MDYRERIKYLRINHELLQKDIADICYVSDATVGHWENKIRHPSIDSIIKLCLHFHISSDYLLGLPPDLLYPKK